MAATVALVLHLVAFGLLFREQDTTEFLIPDEDIFPTDESISLRSPQNHESPRSMSGKRVTEKSSRQGKEDKDGWANVPERVLSSQRTLVESPDPSASFVVGRPSDKNTPRTDGSGSRLGGNENHARSSSLPTRGNLVEDAIPEERDGRVQARPGEAVARPAGDD